MATLNATLRTDKKEDQYGRYPIYIRLTHKGKTKYFSIGASVQPEMWSKRTQSVKNKIDIAGEINEKIDESLDSIEKQINQQITAYGRIDFGEIGLGDKDKNKHDFFGYAAQYIKGLKKYNTIQTSETAVKSFKSFINDKLLLDEIDTPLIRRYKKYMEDKELSGNTINNYITIIQIIYKDAAQNGYLSNPDSNPFWAVPKAKVKSKSQYLTLDELDKLSNADLPQRLILYRDSWLLSFWLAGMRRSDLLTLKTENIDFENKLVTYTMLKTGEEVQLALLPEAESIIRRNMKLGSYILPFMVGYPVSTNYEMHRWLHSVSTRFKVNIPLLWKAAGIDKHLTLHSARHTWTTLTRKYTDLPLKAIQGMLAHKSGRTTDTYMHKLDPYADNPKNMQTVHEQLKKAR